MVNVGVPKNVLETETETYRDVNFVGPVVQGMKLFSLSLTLRTNKLACLPDKPVQLSLIFTSKACGCLLD
jgi:hypothetical protein